MGVVQLSIQNSGCQHFIACQQLGPITHALVGRDQYRPSAIPETPSRRSGAVESRSSASQVQTSPASRTSRTSDNCIDAQSRGTSRLLQGAETATLTRSTTSQGRDHVALTVRRQRSRVRRRRTRVRAPPPRADPPLPTRELRFGTDGANVDVFNRLAGNEPGRALDAIDAEGPQVAPSFAR